MNVNSENIKNYGEFIKMDAEKFNSALLETLSAEHMRNGIGTYSEGTLHAVLKKYYEPDSDRHELKVGKYVADIVGQNGIIEIQTRQLFKMKEKIKAFLEVSDVTVVYPVSAAKYVSWRDESTGEISGRRKSPKKCSVYDAMGELYSLQGFISHPGFHFVVLMLETEDYKDFRLNKYGKKTEVRRFDRIPLKLLSEELFNCKADYGKLIPADLPDEFTSADFGKCAGISRSLAQLTLNIFNNVEIVERIGRDKKGYIYSVCK